MFDVIVSILDLTVNFVTWYIVLLAEIIVIVFLICSETSKCKKIKKETNLNELKEKRDLCEAVNNFFNGAYLAVIGCFFIINGNFWANMLTIFAAVGVIVIAAILQRRLYNYKKRIREIEGF